MYVTMTDPLYEAQCERKVFSYANVAKQDATVLVIIDPFMQDGNGGPLGHLTLWWPFSWYQVVWEPLGGGATSGVVRGNASQAEISNLKVLPLDLCIYNLIKHKV